MSNKKKTYQSPKLNSFSAIEAGSALCCKTTPQTCTNSSKGAAGGGKNRTKDSS